MNYPCFVLTATDRQRHFLRRYVSESKCSMSPVGVHDAWTPAGETTQEIVAPPTPRDDPRWPSACACGHVFTDADVWQDFTDRIYVAADGREFTLRDAPPGAMYFAEWYDTIATPQLEHALVVITPGGPWVVDSQASNCTMKDDFQQQRHHCWIIEGSLPNITVSKNGVTCAAGAGSIQAGKFHGFLRNGVLLGD